MQIIDFKINPSALEVESFNLTDIRIGNEINIRPDYYFDEPKIIPKKFMKIQ